MDLRKGPNIYFEANQHTRSRTIGMTNTQEVNLNTVTKNNQSYDTLKPMPYKPSYISNYNNANQYYKKNNNNNNLYNLNIQDSLATNKELFVKPVVNPLIQSLGNLTGMQQNTMPPHYKENKETRGGQTSLGAINSMRGESKQLRNI
jgi:hypothetical protein